MVIINAKMNYNNRVNTAVYMQLSIDENYF
jgi:hypothetical protein